MQINTLKNGYFNLRTSSSVLREGGFRFEGKHWVPKPKCIERYADGWTLRVYPIENSVEACVIDPAGLSRTYS